ncbi:alaXS [Symbiodinium pilosum]|uniref:AlaXS protein n=1 Tax=Symbiodinium pilosum TaxID=2952 RepID=A0A812XG63_SYMPI|nr:alaXS [Symbiodinium pilosum]
MCADGVTPAGGEGPGAAVRGSSPQPVLRQPSPGPCEETLQSPFFAAALAVIKGAAAQALEIPLALTTESVKPCNDLSGRLTLNSVETFPSKPQRTKFEKLVAEKVSEDAAFRVFTVPKAMAKELYGDTFCGADHPEEELPDPLQLVSLSDWCLAVTEYPVLKSTAQLGRLELTGFKHRNEKGHFEVSFKIHPPGADPPLAEVSTTHAAPPALSELLPSVAAG